MKVKRHYYHPKWFDQEKTDLEYLLCQCHLYKLYHLCRVEEKLMAARM